MAASTYYIDYVSVALCTVCTDVLLLLLLLLLCGSCSLVRIWDLRNRGVFREPPNRGSGGGLLVSVGCDYMPPQTLVSGCCKQVQV